MTASTPWRHLVVAAIVAVVIIGAGGAIGFRLSPVPVIVACLFVGTVWWATAAALPSAVQPPWKKPEPPPDVHLFAADQRTRRTATMIADASFNRSFTQSNLRAALADRLRARVAASRRAGHDIPLADAAQHVSEPFRAYLLRDKAPTLHRRTLRRYLKEIEAL